MEISARSHLTAGASLTAAAAIAFTPLVIPASQQPFPLHRVAVADVALTALPAEVAGIPGAALIRGVDTIVVLINGGFGGVIDATDDPTLVDSLVILKTLSADAYEMLGTNLRRINPVITTTADTVTGQVLAGDGLSAVRTLGDAGFDIVGIARDEVTFQANNAVGGLSALATRLGDATGSDAVRFAVGAVRNSAVAPALGAFNAGSQLAGAVVTGARAAFDATLPGATAVAPAGRAAPDPKPEQEPAARKVTRAAREDQPRSVVDRILRPHRAAPPAGSATRNPLSRIGSRTRDHGTGGRHRLDTASPAAGGDASPEAAKPSEAS